MARIYQPMRLSPDTSSLRRRGEEWPPKQAKRKEWYVGESRLYDVFLIYEPEVEKLKDMALTLDIARKLAAFSTRKKLVFAPTKYLDQEFLDRYKITFCQLPFQIYKAVNDKLTTKGTKNTKEKSSGN